jgi:hypothetical protein
MDQSPVLLRADSAFYGHATIGGAISAGADVSVTTRMDPAVKKAITTIADDAWTGIEYPEAIYDESTGRWISTAEVAEVPYHRVHLPHGQRTSARPVGGTPDPGAERGQEERRTARVVRSAPVPCVLYHQCPGYRRRGQDSPGHAVIEQVIADLKNSALAHLPSGVFTANAA